MLWQSRTPSRALVLQALCILAGILFGVQICSCHITSSNYDKTDNTLLTEFYANLQRVTAITCCSRCHTDSACESAAYNPGSYECRLSSVSFTNLGANSEHSDEWETYTQTVETPLRGRDCSEIGGTGNPPSGVYEISPVGGHDPINVFCDFDDSDGPWTVFQRRVDGTVNFTRNYQEYQAGFGSPSGNFWLGLDKISSISLQDGKYHCLKINVVDPVKGKGFAKYSNFQVKNTATGYTLQIKDYTGDAGDWLLYHNGAPFSTYDNDMDDTTESNCAKDWGGGWWFKNCVKSNLNGKYGHPTKGIAWYAFTDSATFASMKVKQCLSD